MGLDYDVSRCVLQSPKVWLVGDALFFRETQKCDQISRFFGGTCSRYVFEADSKIHFFGKTSFLSGYKRCKTKLATLDRLETTAGSGSISFMVKFVCTWCFDVFLGDFGASQPPRPHVVSALLSPNRFEVRQGTSGATFGHTRVRF